MAWDLVIVETIKNNFSIMLKNNFILAFRLLTRQRIFSFINLLGLSLGMACFLIIVLFYQYQKSYDQFHAKKDQIYRINRHLDGIKGKRRVSKIAPSVIESVRGNIPEIKNVVRLVDMGQELHYGDKGFNEMFLCAADNTFFEIFDFELVAGDPSSALSDLNSVVLNETLSKKYFGNESPLGKIMSTVGKNGQKVDITVTGIMKDIPANTHLTVDAIFSFSTLRNFVSVEEQNSNWYMSHTYILLDKKANPKAIEKQIFDLVGHQIPMEDFENASLPLQLITDIYFNPTKDGGAQRGSEQLTSIFLLIGVFVLLIASLNYINLSTAKSLKRSKEVGIRKVSGASKHQLVYQFIGESVVFALFSLLLALFFVGRFIPTLNNFSNFMFKIDLNSYFFLDPQFMAIAIAAAILTGLLSGIYPAFVISSFQPSKSLKGESVGRNKLSAKKLLVVAQYVVSIFLVICCITIYKIFDHMRNKDYGFDQENILAVNVAKINDPAQILDLKHRFQRIDGVTKVAAASKIPLSVSGEITFTIYNEKKKFKTGIAAVYIDDQYFDLLDMEMKQSIHAAGETLENENGMFVNQAFIEKYGEQYALGDALDVYKFADTDKLLFTSNVTGVVENVKNRSFDPSIGPIIYKMDQSNLSQILLELTPGEQHASIAAIEAEFKERYPHLAFEMRFIEDEVNFAFSMLTPFSKLIYYATFFAIFIASMGLFALALFVTQQRTKEIGIRKIFGSSELNISLLLASQFVKLILISFIIAGPLTFYGCRWLLMKFPDKIVLSWSLLGGAGFTFILIALITVMGQSWQAAKSNPVDTLRYE